MQGITSTRLGDIYVRREADIVKVRERVRRLAREMGFDSTTQIKITTAVSELTRNIYEYARSGAITLSLATRGAVMGAVVLDHARRTFNYAGVGNVEVRVLGAAEPARPIPANGTLGARLSQVRVWPHRWQEGTTLVIASDGISATWDAAAYPGLLTKSPQLLAGVLLRDFGRNSDDATVLVYK